MDGGISSRGWWMTLSHVLILCPCVRPAAFLVVIISSHTPPVAFRLTNHQNWGRDSGTSECVCACPWVCLCGRETVRDGGRESVRVCISMSLSGRRGTPSTSKADRQAASLIVSFNSKRHLRILGIGVHGEDGASQFFCFVFLLAFWIGGWANLLSGKSGELSTSWTCHFHIDSF